MSASSRRAPGLCAGLISLWVVACNADKAGQAASKECLDALAALDADGDAYVPDDAALPSSCSELTLDEALTAGELSTGDCDDGDATVNPGASDDCQGQIDRNCDGSVDPLQTWYTDGDEDGYGDPDGLVQDCTQPDGTVEQAGDCNDQRANINPDAVETACGPDVDDLNCDGETDCALAGAISLTDDPGDLGAWVALDSGGGAALAGEDDLAVAGGDEAAWTITGDGRDAAAELLDLGFEAGEEAGADVAIVDGVVAVGGPTWDDPEGGTYGTDVGRAYLSSGGILHGSAAGAVVGRRLAAGGGTLAVGRFGGTTWDAFLIPEASLPGAGDNTSVADLDVTTLSGLSGSAAAPPALALVKDAGTLYVAVGQPADTTSKLRAQIYAATSEGVTLALSIKSTSTTFGASVALMDLDGSGSLDLVVGDSGTSKTVYVFLDPPSDGSTIDLSSASADYTFSGDTSTGQSLANAGDINGDGNDDLLIGAQNTAYLVLGGDLGEGPDLSPYAVFSTSTGADLAAALAAADLDGDGFSDLLLGAPGAGGVYVLWGGP